MYKLLILWCVWQSSVAQNIQSNFPRNGCHSLLHPMDLNFDIYCTNIIQINYYSVSRSYYPRCDRKLLNIDVCTVFLHLRDPMGSLQCSEGCGYIYLLDISGNEYEEIPTIRSMENLVILNVSHNNLKSAKLYNTYELSNLKEVDFSNNIINEIVIEENKYIYKKIEKLNLSSNYLVNIKNAIFSSFTEMKVLDISNNFIDYVNVLSFEGLKKLTYLKMSSNRILDINLSLMRFVKLEELDLSKNLIEKLGKESLSELQNLKEINLSYNKLQSIESNVFIHNLQLQKVDLSQNLLTTISSETFVYTSIIEIDISMNKIKNLPIHLFQGKQLQRFFIHGNQLEGSLQKGIFEGLTDVDKLNLSSQYLTTIGSNSFAGLKSVTVLLLNNNLLATVDNEAFIGLDNLRMLDLSYNKIKIITFSEGLLINLNSLFLQFNDLDTINNTTFQSLQSLISLNLSNNNISDIESNFLNSMESLMEFQISNNPISGDLKQNTFNGLQSLPSLDISGSNLSKIANFSFNRMTNLKILNISNSKLQLLEFNLFTNTGNLEQLDFSTNFLEDFCVNNTELKKLKILYLNNNYLKILSTNFLGLYKLEQLYLSQNKIENISKDTFNSQLALNYLDLSYNDINYFDSLVLHNMQSLTVFNLSGIKSEKSFLGVPHTPLFELNLCNCSIQNITSLHLNYFNELNTLRLNVNSITDVEGVAFQNLTDLRYLDLSFNEINFIQPGVFRDNIYLEKLNVSHNVLTEISYGIFRGLKYIQTLDISYNSISSLKSERFYELESLSILIADGNRIKFIEAEEFSQSALSILSIGSNPIACDLLVKLKKSRVRFTITSMYYNENSKENVDGVDCQGSVKEKFEPETINNTQILKDLMSEFKKVILISKNSENITNSGKNEILLLESIKNVTQQFFKNSNAYFRNISLKNYEEKEALSTFMINANNSTHAILKNQSQILSIMSNNSIKTNFLLEKIVKLLPLAPISDKQNSSISSNDDSVTTNSTKSKETLTQNEIDNSIMRKIQIEKQNIMAEIEEKIAQISNKHSSSFLRTDTNDSPINPAITVRGTSIFTDVCVALILFILVGFILFKFFRKRSFSFQRDTVRSLSTRRIADSMESPNL